MDNVREMVSSQIAEEGNRRLASPSWVWKAQENLNHTGEQPLIIQQYLSPNKKKQVDGVLPAGSRLTKGRALSRSAGCNDSRLRFHHYPGPHQYLSATPVSPQYHKSIADFKHGRPTRASLLRAKKRHPSAPGIRAAVTMKMGSNSPEADGKKDNRRRCKSVGKSDSSSSTKGETFHQFLVGARYNRGHYHDAKCLSQLGLYVCREDTGNCFMHTSCTSHDQISLSATHSGSTSSSPSGRTSRSTPHPLKAHTPYEQDNQAAINHNDREQRLDHSEDLARPTTPTATPRLIDGTGVVQDSCILCEGGVPLTGVGSPAWSKSARGKFDPAKRWSGKKGCRTESRRKPTDVGCIVEGPCYNRAKAGTPTSPDDVDRMPREIERMALQQYHLRIMGTQVRVDNCTASPRTNSPSPNYKKMVNLPPSTSSGSTRGGVNCNNNNDCLRRDTIESDITPRGHHSHISVPVVDTESTLGDDKEVEFYHRQPSALREANCVMPGASVDKNTQMASEGGVCEHFCEKEQLVARIDEDDKGGGEGYLDIVSRHITQEGRTCGEIDVNTSN